MLEQQRARRRDVEVAFIEGERVALASGLEAGEQVITDGAQYLEDGESVAIVDTLAARPATEMSRWKAGSRRHEPS